jgi:hypothetical protein
MGELLSISSRFFSLFGPSRFFHDLWILFDHQTWGTCYMIWIDMVM